MNGRRRRICRLELPTGSVVSSALALLWLLMSLRRLPCLAAASRIPSLPLSTPSSSWAPTSSEKGRGAEPETRSARGCKRGWRESGTAQMAQRKAVISPACDPHTPSFPCLSVSSGYKGGLRPVSRRLQSNSASGSQSVMCGSLEGQRGKRQAKGHADAMRGAKGYSHGMEGAGGGK